MFQSVKVAEMSLKMQKQLTWFIRYIYYWNLQFLNKVFINKTKALPPQALADFGYHV